MSDEYIYTYGDIIVSTYEFIKLINLKIERKINEHAKLYLKGIIDDSKGDQYVENANTESYINISVKNDKSNVRNLFQGLITNISINNINNVMMLEIQAISQTFLMDIKKKSRTFQNSNNTYKDVIDKVNSDYNNVQVCDDFTSNSKIDTMLAQYKETDWEFIKRLASHFNQAVIPECQLSEIKYTIGNSGNKDIYELNEYNYSINKELQEYKIKHENGLDDIDDSNFITYDVITNKILNLFDRVRFVNRILYVYEANIEMKESIIKNQYKLRDEKGIKVKKYYNNKISGISLNGTILDTKNDVVKVNLDVDGNQNSEGARWFPYSTVYSSEDGTGWYCMPEVGDAIRVYFPDNEEKNSYAISSVNLKSSNSQKRSDPSVKSIGTKYGKELVMEPGAVNIIGGDGLMVKMVDGDGIQIISNKKIILDAQDDIEINGKAKVSINGEEGVDLTQNSAKLNIKDDVTLSGGKVKIE